MPQNRIKSTVRHLWRLIRVKKIGDVKSGSVEDPSSTKTKGQDQTNHNRLGDRKERIL